MDTSRAEDGERRVASDQWDIDGWHMLASEAEKASFSVAQPIYERLVSQFPPVGRLWKIYAEHCAREAPEGNADIEEIYSRAVQAAPTSLDLWRSYTAWKVSLAVEVPGSKLESDAIAVFERAITSAGLDLNAHPLWSSYIEFLKKHTALSDNQRRDVLRRVYQRAVRNPMQNLDAFWREYTAFEQSSNTNKELARGLISENQPKNIDARAEYRARRGRREGLTLTALPVPPRGRAKETYQAQQWRRFIAHERANPSSLSVTDLNGRIIHAFEAALCPLYRYPDIWMEYLSYVYGTFMRDGQPPPVKPGTKEASMGGRDDTTLKNAAAALEPLLTRAIKALPNSVGLHTHVNWLYVRLGNAAKGVSVLDTLCRRHPSPLAYIHLMRAARKADGRDAARKVFGRARKDPQSNDPAVYTAAAHMEFRVNKDPKVAGNVFSLGMKHNRKSAEMAVQYVNWLWGIGDLEQARIILKQATPEVTGPPESVRALWERWLELEEIIGDAASVDGVERMWKDSESGKANSLVQDVLRRSRFLEFEGLSENEIASIDGLRSSATDKSGTASGPSTGKRDPRTGRRVVATGSGRDGGANGTAGAPRGGDAIAESPLKTATDWLRRMASSLPPIVGPAPSVDVLFKMLTETPDAFSATPAGSKEKSVVRKTKQETMTGKKRKGEEVIFVQESSLAENVSAPAQDVFRARQAAKQSRMR